MKDLKIIANKLDLSLEVVTKIIVAEHSFKLGIKTETIEVDLDLDTIEHLDNLADKLLVSRDAVIGGILSDYVEKRKDDQKAIRSKTLRRKR